MRAKHAHAHAHDRNRVTGPFQCNKHRTAPPELSHSGSQSTGFSLQLQTPCDWSPPSPTGTPWRSTPSCHPWQRRPPFLFLVRQRRNEVCVPFPLTFLLLPPLSLHIFPSLYFLTRR